MGDGRESRAEDGTAGQRGAVVWRLDAAVGSARVRVRRAHGVKASALAVHAAVPPVLHSVVAAVPKSPRNLRPALAHLANHAFNHQALFRGDGLAVQ